MCPLISGTAPPVLPQGGHRQRRQPLPHRAHLPERGKPAAGSAAQHLWGAHVAGWRRSCGAASTVPRGGRHCRRSVDRSAARLPLRCRWRRAARLAFPTSPPPAATTAQTSPTARARRARSRLRQRLAGRTHGRKPLAAAPCSSMRASMPPRLRRCWRSSPGRATPCSSTPSSPPASWSGAACTPRGEGATARRRGGGLPGLRPPAPPAASSGCARLPRALQCRRAPVLLLTSARTSRVRPCSSTLLPRQPRHQGRQVERAQVGARGALRRGEHAQRVQHAQRAQRKGTPSASLLLAARQGGSRGALQLRWGGAASGGGRPRRSAPNNPLRLSALRAILQGGEVPVAIEQKTQVGAGGAWFANRHVFAAAAAAKSLSAHLPLPPTPNLCLGGCPLPQLPRPGVHVRVLGRQRRVRAQPCGACGGKRGVSGGAAGAGGSRAGAPGGRPRRRQQQGHRAPTRTLPCHPRSLPAVHDWHQGAPR